MTGYGRAELSGAELALRVEVRSLNHRFLELSFKLPRGLAFLEPEARRLVQSRFHRGRFDVTVAVTQLVEAGLGLTGEVTLPTILKCAEVLALEDEALPNEAGALFHRAMDQALGALREMRRSEGEALHTELLRHCLALEESAELIEKRQPEILQRYHERLRTRVTELAEGLSLSEERLAMEVALLAERSDVAEELLRLRSHLSQFREHLATGGAVGRSLDFLVQEMQREVNTIGAKADDLEITRLILVAKGAVEKLREQVQNVE